MSEQIQLIQFDDEPPVSDPYLTEQDVITEFKVSRTTLWRLRLEGLPHVSVGRQVRYRLGAVVEWLERSNGPEGGRGRRRAKASNQTADAIPPCHWSHAVALDPRHRPQTPFAPSSTVRREWWRFPQEAHLLDPGIGRYRRLRAHEVAVLQGFAPEWASAAGIGELDQIRGYGNAVPPSLARAVINGILKTLDHPLRTSVEVCAGFGGLAVGAADAAGLKHLALIDNWNVATRTLRANGPWPVDSVLEQDVCDVEWQRFTDSVDLLTGGPPCQPWSIGGARRGARDERDLLGLMPDVVGVVRPVAFVFENVPGLLAGDNEAYARWLLDRLRRPAPGLDYAVAAATLNAADFGVPQIRRRVFIVGLLGKSACAVHQTFDAIAALRTHADPKLPLPQGRGPWNTIDSALPDWARVEDGWRRWITMGADSNDPESSEPLETRGEIAQRNLPSRRPRISLSWPHRDCRTEWTPGGWAPLDQVDDPLRTEVRPLLVGGDGLAADPVADPWFVVGDSVAALGALTRTHARRAQLVYLDLPRITTNAAAFDAVEEQSALDTWLTLVQGLLRRGLRLLADEGAIVALCGVGELPYVQMLLTELAGVKNYVGTVAWQKGYSPRNIPNQRELSPTHDNLVIFARRKEVLPAVALRVPPEGFANPDADPRGPWNAEHKGANKDDYTFEVNLAPYRWRIVDGTLPPGMWRISERSGVIWARRGDLKTPGLFKFTVEVEDQKGTKARRAMSIQVAKDVEPPALVPPPWLIAQLDEGRVLNGPDTSGDLRIVTDKLPVARLGEEYSAVAIASGGTPWIGTTKPGKTSTPGSRPKRFWEYSPETLLQAAARDAVDFKSKADAIPAVKRYLDGAESAPRNVETVWLGGDKRRAQGQLVGYSQDAKAELTDMQAENVIQEVITFSKPATLMLRLIALFTQPQGLVVDIGAPAAEMAAIATMTGRRAVYVELPSNSGLRHSLTSPRLLYASRGRHPLPEDCVFAADLDGEAAERGLVINGQRRATTESAGLLTVELGAPAARIDRPAAVVELDYVTYPPGSDAFLRMLANIEGLVAVSGRGWFAEALWEPLRAVYVQSKEFVDGTLLEGVTEDHAEFLRTGGRVRIYYHRGQSSSLMPVGSGVELRRIPFDLQLTAGLF